VRQQRSWNETVHAGHCDRLVAWPAEYVAHKNNTQNSQTKRQSKLVKGGYYSILQEILVNAHEMRKSL